MMGEPTERANLNSRELKNFGPIVREPLLGQFKASKAPSSEIRTFP